ncbi:hypothetical protein KM043_007532 [Ampulex compressa]|nr:hypothetical protein KM043_007532 [Ampulex compressa]
MRALGPQASMAILRSSSRPLPATSASPEPDEGKEGREFALDEAGEAGKRGKGKRRDGEAGEKEGRSRRYEEAAEAAAVAAAVPGHQGTDLGCACAWAGCRRPWRGAPEGRKFIGGEWRRAGTEVGLEVDGGGSRGGGGGTSIPRARRVSRQRPASLRPGTEGPGPASGSILSGFVAADGPSPRLIEERGARGAGGDERSGESKEHVPRA